MKPYRNVNSAYYSGEQFSVFQYPVARRFSVLTGSTSIVTTTTTTTTTTIILKRWQQQPENLLTNSHLGHLRLRLWILLRTLLNGFVFRREYIFQNNFNFWC